MVPLKHPLEPFALYVDFNNEELDDLFVTKILDRKYDKVDLDLVVAVQTHMMDEQKHIFWEALEGHDKLFNG